MAGSLAANTAAPQKVKGPDAHSAAKPGKGFGGRIAERGMEIVTKPGVNNFTATPPSGQYFSENERPTVVPAGSKAELTSRIIEQEKRIHDQEKPTYRPPRTPKNSAKPATEQSMLSPDSEEFRSTSSFAPPPAIVQKKAGCWEMEPLDEARVA